MRTFIATFFFAILAFGANAQERSSEIRSTIESQLKALQQDDFAAAFEFASPNIQTMFRNSANFGMMPPQQSNNNNKKQQPSNKPDPFANLF